jgi:hypothetical protein
MACEKWNRMSEVNLTNICLHIARNVLSPIHEKKKMLFAYFELHLNQWSLFGMIGTGNWRIVTLRLKLAMEYLQILQFMQVSCDKRDQCIKFRDCVSWVFVESKSWLLKMRDNFDLSSIIRENDG